MDKAENPIRWLMKWMDDVKWTYIYGAILTLISASCFIVFSWYIAKFSKLWLIEDQTEAINLIYAFTFLGGRYVFAHFASLLNYKAGSDVVSLVKKKIYPRLLAEIHNDAISSTLLVTRVSDDLKPFFSSFIPYGLASGLVAILLIIVGFIADFWVGLIMTFSIIIIPLLMSIIGIGASSLHNKHINLFMKYSEVFYNRLQTVAEIVNLDNMNTQHEFLSEKSKLLNKATTSVMRIAILSSAGLELFVSIAIAGVAIYLGLSLMGFMPGKSYSVGYDFHLALFLLILAPYLFFYMRKFVSAYHDKNRALASAKLIMPLLKCNNNAVPKAKNEDLSSLSIKGLDFSYPDRPVKVLHNINVNLPQKGLVLIKGISGSGKSTLLKILSGELDYIEGNVSINGKDNQWSAQWLKENTSYMNQFPFIFDGSLRYNVFLSDEAIENIDYPYFMEKLLLKKDSAWDTILSHNGKQFSGGEKQLITLARMILYPRKIAILDEPTANLDSLTAETVIKEIKNMARKQLVILASHNENFEAIANEVLNLNWGEQVNYA